MSDQLPPLGGSKETDINPLSRANRGRALRAVCYLVFGVAAAFFLLTFLSYPGDFAYEMRGRVVQATIEAVQVDSEDPQATGDGGLGSEDWHRRHRVEYSFVDHAGQPHRGAARVGGKGYRVGDSIKVQYQTAEPEHNRPTRNSRLRQNLGPDVQTLLIGSLMAVGFLALAYLVTHRRALLLLVGWLGRHLPGGRRVWRKRAPAGEDAPRFPLAWEQALRRNMALYQRLSPAEQVQLQDLVVDFVPMREWSGVDGQHVTDEMKATVAGQACLLLLGIREHDLFAEVRSIILHPGTFRRQGHVPLGETGVVLEDQQALLGEAWYRGPVLLSWREVLAGGRDADGGSNVVYHEFAHQLDFRGEDLLESLSEEAQERHRRWAEVMQREFDALVVAARHGRPTLLDHYGASNSQEFFAVSTECFFEKPIEMAEKHPELYGVLREFYGQDPARRLDAYRAARELMHQKEHQAQL